MLVELGVVEQRYRAVSLASVAPSVWYDGGGHATSPPRGPESSGAVLSQLDLSSTAQKAVALAQQEKSAWTRADLIKYLGRVLPRSGLEPAVAVAAGFDRLVIECRDIQR